MLESVDVGRRALDDYADSAGVEAINEVHALADDPRGVRVLHLNATPYGSGVTEIPLLRTRFCGTSAWMQIGS